MERAAVARKARADMQAAGLRRCNACKQVKPLEDYHRSLNSSYLGIQATCKDCVRQRHIDNPELMRKRSWISHLKRKYGLTLDQWSALLISQSGLCAICSEPMREPHTDHCHQTERVRGLLCNNCNVRLHDGASEQWFKDAVAYLFG